MIALCSKCYNIEEVEGEKKKFSTKGMSKTAFQVSVGWQQGHGNEYWFSHEQREDGYVGAAEAGAERSLRQTLGIGRRHSHRANRVS